MKANIGIGVRVKERKSGRVEREKMSWIGFRDCGMTRAKKRVTAVGCPCLTGLGLGQFML